LLDRCDSGYGFGCGGAQKKHLARNISREGQLVSATLNFSHSYSKHQQNLRYQKRELEKLSGTLLFLFQSE
jgi:hypothetical protein